MLKITHISENEEKEYLLMTHDEKRAIRREWINYYMQEDRIHVSKDLPIRDLVRNMEKWLYGQELKTY